MIGMSSALALALAASCVVYAHRHPQGASASVLDKYSKDANHFGTAAHEPWGKPLASLPMSYMGFNCSLSSTSSSFRDYRFISCFNPDGAPIPQFDPNTAGAVVIGSVTIGGDSSFSSGPFGSQASARSQSFLSVGKISRRQDSPKSESGMSSLSSNRSTSRKTPRYRTFNHQHPKLNNRNRVKSRSMRSIGTATGSNGSRNTLPMSRRQQKYYDRRNNKITLADWRAVSFMTESRHPSQATDRAAAINQGSVFFNALLYSESSVSSSDPSMTYQSVPNIHSNGSFDAGSSSILCKCPTSTSFNP